MYYDKSHILVTTVLFLTFLAYKTEVSFVKWAILLQYNTIKDLYILLIKVKIMISENVFV